MGVFLFWCSWLRCFDFSPSLCHFFLCNKITSVLWGFHQKKKCSHYISSYVVVCITLTEPKTIFEINPRTSSFLDIDELILIELANWQVPAIYTRTSARHFSHNAANLISIYAKNYKCLTRFGGAIAPLFSDVDPPLLPTKANPC